MRIYRNTADGQRYYAMGSQFMMTGSQARASRATLRWTVADVAVKAGVAPNTVTRVEADKSVNTATLKAMQAAYEIAGIQFIPENGGGAGVRMRKASA